MKVIFHLDLDSYFVSAQRTIDPSLKGKVVVISGGKKRSIIAAASYEAKAKGIYVPMPFYKAKEIDPNVIAVAPDFALYTVLSTKLFELLSSKITKDIEVASIDECYLDVTDVWKKYGSPKKLAEYIQKLVLEELKLPISVGIANNKFVAKMSTQINKPFGITVTKPGDFKKVFQDWPTSKIHGVGLPTEAVLKKAGIITIGDMIDSSREKLVEVLGVRGNSLWDNVNENGSSLIDKELNDLKGIGNSITFMENDKYERYDILDVLKHLCNTVSIRLENRNMAGTVVSVAIKESGGVEVKAKRKQVTLPRPIMKTEEVFEVARGIFDSIWNEDAIKFIGVHVTKLNDVYENSYQQSIFDEPVERSKIELIMDNVNAKLGHKTLISLKEGSKNLKKKQNQSRFLEADRVTKRYKK